MRDENFIRPELEFKMDVVKGAADIIPAFRHRQSTSRGKVPLEPVRKTL
jgi:hypothetical protein